MKGYEYTGKGRENSSNTALDVTEVEGDYVPVNRRERRAIKAKARKKKPASPAVGKGGRR